MNPYTLIDMCENLDEETLNVIEKRLTGKHPNTYTFTKSMAEQVILMKGRGLPMAVVRPSIVGAAYQEPFPGWVDNVGGITGLKLKFQCSTGRELILLFNRRHDGDRQRYHEKHRMQREYGHRPGTG